MNPINYKDINHSYIINYIKIFILYFNLLLSISNKIEFHNLKIIFFIWSGK
jgi:hypothetical protein